MKFPDELEIEISPDGIITSLYIDGLAEELGAEILKVERASNVLWDKHKKGWEIYHAGTRFDYVIRDDEGQYVTLRRYSDEIRPELKMSVGNIPPAVFTSRDEAIEVEKRLYRQFIERK